jgi:hypothetical protein
LTLKFKKMDTLASAKRTGALLALKAITAGLIIAYLIMASIESSLLWLLHFEYAKTMLLGILVTYASGYFFGGLAGKSILLKHRHELLTGVLYGFLIVWSSTFLASLPAFFAEGFSQPISESFVDYIGKPLWWVTFFGSLPVLFVGLWYGHAVKVEGNKELADSDN